MYLTTTVGLGAGWCRQDWWDTQGSWNRDNSFYSVPSLCYIAIVRRKWRSWEMKNLVQRSGPPLAKACVCACVYMLWWRLLCALQTLSLRRSHVLFGVCLTSLWYYPMQLHTHFGKRSAPPLHRLWCLHTPNMTQTDSLQCTECVSMCISCGCIMHVKLKAMAHNTGVCHTIVLN